MVRFNRPPAEWEAQTHAGAVGAPLLVGTKQVVNVPIREPAAFVLDLDDHALEAGVDREGDGGARSGELERILQQVSETTAARVSRSASIVMPFSTGRTVRVTSFAWASKVAAGASSSMNSDTRNRVGCWTPCVRRTSASDRPTSSLMPLRLRLVTR
jgi:hypothetical protein